MGEGRKWSAHGQNGALTQICHRTDAGRPAIESAFRRAMAGTHWVGSFASWRNTFRISPFELPTEEIIQCQCLLLQELGDSASLTTDRRAPKSQAAPTRLTS